jgi:uncharacterized protein YjbJ (UPF0337 family)
MKNEDERVGRMKDVKGRVKEAAGIITGNERLENEGAGDRQAGRTEEALGRARRKVGEAVEDLGDKIKR